MSRLPSHYTGPGLVDIQLNGYAGFDFNGDPARWTVEEFLRVRSALLARGVTAVLPTILTDEPTDMIARAQRYAEILADEPQLVRTMPKLHIEGPFLSEMDGPRGAHPRNHCRTPLDLPDLIDRLGEVSRDRIAILTIAPELPGMLELIRRCTEAGICVAIGHTNAPNEILDAAVAAGARMSTHLGNGSHNTLPRLDNYLQRQLSDDRMGASFIADGHHMPFGTLKNFIRAKTIDRSILITDAIAAADTEPGRYFVGGQEVVVSSDGRVAVPGALNLAGSSLTLDKAVINTFLHCGVTFEQAWAMASTNPAAMVNLPVQEEITVEISDSGFERQ